MTDGEHCPTCGEPVRVVVRGSLVARASARELWIEKVARLKKERDDARDEAAQWEGSFKGMVAVERELKERLEKVREAGMELVRLIEAGVSGTGTDHHHNIESAAHRLDRALNETASEPDDGEPLHGNPVARFQAWLNR